jgi:hypothetical protein
MSKKEMALGLALSYDDMCSIAAACGTMSISMLKEADCAKDLAEALHLGELHLRIVAAIRKAAAEIKAQKEHDAKES